LIYQFNQFIRSAGGFSIALELMGNVAKAVWDGVNATAGSFVDDFRALRSDMDAIWLRLMAFAARTITTSLLSSCTTGISEPVVRAICPPA